MSLTRHHGGKLPMRSASAGQERACLSPCDLPSLPHGSYLTISNTPAQDVAHPRPYGQWKFRTRCWDRRLSTCGCQVRNMQPRSMLLLTEPDCKTHRTSHEYRAACHEHCGQSCWCTVQSLTGPRWCTESLVLVHCHVNTCPSPAWLRARHPLYNSSLTWGYVGLRVQAVTSS